MKRPKARVTIDCSNLEVVVHNTAVEDMMATSTLEVMF